MWFRFGQILTSFILIGSVSGCSLALDFDETSGQPESVAPTFCAQHLGPPAVFCDDFDAEALGTKWPALEQLNGSAANDSEAATSAPNSFLSVASPIGAGGRVRSVGTVTFPTISSRRVGLRISLNLRIDQFDPTVGAENVVFAFLYGKVNDLNQVQLKLVSTGSAVTIAAAEGAETVGSAEPPDYAEHGSFKTKPVVGEWLNVQVDVDIVDPVGLGNHVRLRRDGLPELDFPLDFPLKGETPRVELGIGYVKSEQPTQSWAVRYDDFLVETVSLD